MPQPCRADVNTAALRGLIEKLDRVRAEQELPAYALVVSNASETLLSEVRGVAEAGSDSSASTDSWFRIGSITKTFVALACLRAQEQGQLDLKQPVAEALGDGYFQNPWAKQQPLQLVHLLEQTSGFRDMSKGEWDHNTPIALDRALRQFADEHTLSWPAGRYFSYSNTNFGLAGRVLERATGLAFEDYLAAMVFKPMGINKVSLHYDAVLAKRLIAGYNSDGHTPIKYWHTIYRPLGAMSLAPNEMAPLLRLFLNRGAPLLRADSIQRMETPTSSLAARVGLKYGYGLGLYDWFHNGHRFYGHGGDGDGYLAHFGYQREAGLAYFLVINAFQKKTLNKMRKLVEAVIVEALEQPKHPPIHPLKNAQQYSGTYYPVSWRFGDKAATNHLRIFIKRQQLYAQFVDSSGQREDAYPLLAVSENLFRWPQQPAATMAIVKTADGLLFSGDEGNFLKR